MFSQIARNIIYFLLLLLAARTLVNNITSKWNTILGYILFIYKYFTHRLNLTMVSSY